MKEFSEDSSISSIIPVDFFNENSGLEDAIILSIELLEEVRPSLIEETDNSNILNETVHLTFEAEVYQYNLSSPP